MLIVCFATDARNAALTVALCDDESVATAASASAASRTAAAAKGPHAGTTTGTTINDPARSRYIGASSTTIEPLHVLAYGSLQIRLCKDVKCSVECRLYEKPLYKCYNGQDMFPDDPSWSEYDILDAYLCNEIGTVDTVAGRAQDGRINTSACNSFVRTFYASKDSTCQDKTDSFDSLPLKECIGPFGEPRPWGVFSVVDIDSSTVNSNVI